MHVLPPDSTTTPLTSADVPERADAQDLGHWVGSTLDFFGHAAGDIAQQLNPAPLMQGLLVATGATVTPLAGQCMPLPLRSRRLRTHPVEPAQVWFKSGLAARLTSTHADFVQAMVTTHLHRVFVRRGENIQCTPDGEPMLLVRGALTPWSQVKQQFLFNQDGISTVAGERCAYLRDGLAVWNAATWGPQGHTMRPSRQLPAALRPETCELHVVMAHGDEHAWCRLVNPSGDVITFGAAIDVDAYRNYGPVLNTVVGTVNSPDRYDVMGYASDVRRVRLSPEKAAQVQHFVETSARDGITFNWLNRNCNTFTTDVIACASGVRPATFTSPQQYVMRHSVLAGFIPQPARDFLDGLVTLSTLGFNPLIQSTTTLLGGAQASNPRGERYLENPFQLMTPLLFTDPDKLRDWLQAGGDDSWSEPAQDEGAF